MIFQIAAALLSTTLLPFIKATPISCASCAPLKTGNSFLKGLTSTTIQSSYETDAYGCVLQLTVVCTGYGRVEIVAERESEPVKVLNSYDDVSDSGSTLHVVLTTLSCGPTGWTDQHDEQSLIDSSLTCQVSRLTPANGPFVLASKKRLKPRFWQWLKEGFESISISNPDFYCC